MFLFLFRFLSCGVVVLYAHDCSCGYIFLSSFFALFLIIKLQLYLLLLFNIILVSLHKNVYIAMHYYFN